MKQIDDYQVLIKQLKTQRTTLNEKIMNFGVLVHDLEEKNKVLERKVVELVNELSVANETFRELNTSTKKLDHIWNIQKQAHDEKGLGYEKITKIH